MGDLSRVSPHLDWIQQTFVQEVGAENEWMNGFMFFLCHVSMFGGH